MKSLADIHPRYNAQINLTNFGIATQLKLQQASIVVIGAGGLGTTILCALAGAGIGYIGIVDADIIETSNLHRQFLYTEQEVGKSKVEVISRRLKDYNPHIKFQTYTVNLTYNNAKQILSNYQIVIDASDNLPTRYIISDTCVLLNKPMVYGAIHGTELRIAVLNYQDNASYRCLYPQTLSLSQLGQSCQNEGVLPSSCMLLGSLQAQEAIKIAGCYGEILKTLLIIDSQNNKFYHFQLPKRLKNLKYLISQNYHPPIFSIKAQALRQLLASNSNACGPSRQIIDIRPSYQVRDKPIDGALNIKTQVLIDEAQARFSQIKEVYLICSMGVQSQILSIQLAKLCPQVRFFNVEGGANAYFA